MSQICLQNPLPIVGHTACVLRLALGCGLVCKEFSLGPGRLWLQLKEAVAWIHTQDLPSSAQASLPPDMPSLWIVYTSILSSSPAVAPQALRVVAKPLWPDLSPLAFQWTSSFHLGY